MADDLDVEDLLEAPFKKEPERVSGRISCDLYAHLAKLARWSVCVCGCVGEMVPCAMT